MNHLNFLPKELEDIIIDYKEQMERIDGLENELDDGTINFEIKLNSNKIRFEINIRQDITNIYFNNELKFKDSEFIEYFVKQQMYARNAIYQYIVKKILLRYYLLPFDKPEYYENVDAILYAIFDDAIASIFEDVEYTLIDEYKRCPIRNPVLDCDWNSRNFYQEVIEYLDNEEPYVVRNNFSVIRDFFRNMNH